MKIDRDLQLEVLSFCRDAYPASADLTQSPFWDHPHIHANLIYLQEHQLIDGTLVNGNMEIWNPGITAKGLDFLEDDGGLSAILGIWANTRCSRFLAVTRCCTPIPIRWRAPWPRSRTTSTRGSGWGRSRVPTAA